MNEEPLKFSSGDGENKSKSDSIDNKPEEPEIPPTIKTPAEPPPHLKSRRKSQQQEKEKIKKDPSSKMFYKGTFSHISSVLRGEIFSGWVTERQWIEKLKGYRDVIEIDEWEDNLNSGLKEIVDSIPGVREGKKWINITAPSSSTPCYQLWVLLERIPLPGHYWFQVKEISSNEQFGLNLTIETLRSIHEFDGESQAQRAQRLSGEVSPDEWKEWFAALSNVQVKKVFVNLLVSVKPSNIFLFFRLLLIGIIMMLSSLWNCMLEFNNFSLRLIHHVGVFVHHATPLLQSVIKFVEKIIGGIFVLLAMVYRDIRSGGSHPKHFPPPPPEGAARALPPPPRQGPPRYIGPNAWVYRDNS